MSNLINESGKIVRWPKKVSDKYFVIKWISNKFIFNKKYSESEINLIIEKYHSFHDAALLRRELISKHYLDRKKDGSVYWRTN